VEKIVNQQSLNTSYHYYSTECFRLLKSWLSFCAQDLPVLILKEPALDNSLTLIKEKLGDKIVHIITILGFDDFFHHASIQCKNKKAVTTQFQHWFDGFLTLRFIRLAQEHYFPEEPLDQCLADFSVLMERL